MKFSIQPLNFIDINNFVDISAFEIIPNTSQTIYFVLQKVDSLGTRRFVPAAGTSVSVAFLRSRPATVDSTSQTVSKTGIQVSADDKSLFKVDLSAAETKLILTGSLQLTVTQNGNAQTFSLQYLVKRINGGPGF